MKLFMIVIFLILIDSHFVVVVCVCDSIDFAEQLFPYLMQLFEKNYGVWQRAKQVFKSKLLEV